MAKPKWERRLSLPLTTTDGTVLRTLREAADFIATLPEARVNGRQYWRRCVELLVSAANGEETVDAATEQLYRALFLDGKLKL